LKLKSAKFPKTKQQQQQNNNKIALKKRKFWVVFLDSLVVYGDVIRVTDYNKHNNTKGKMSMQNIPINGINQNHKNWNTIMVVLESIIKACIIDMIKPQT
jgi:hypothetical protein